MDAETKKYFDRINEKLSLLIEEKKKETWVSASWITDLTGWSKERMRIAREQGVVKYKKSKEQSYKYLLESIPQQFIKQAQ